MPHPSGRREVTPPPPAWPGLPQVYQTEHEIATCLPKIIKTGFK